MRGTRVSFNLRQGLILLLMATMFGQVHANQCAPQWTRMELQGGGVMEKMVKVRMGSSDVVWAAGMASGINRAVWNASSQTYDPWTQYLPGHCVYGLDVVTVTVAGTPVEHVMCGGPLWGVLYQSAEGGSFPQSSSGSPDAWHRPATIYPTAWKSAFIHDVAFWCDAEGYWWANPASQYLVILNEQLIPPSGPQPGVYKWNNNNFERIDNGGENPRHFQHFYRDIQDNSTVYVIRNAQNGVWAALYKLTGPYNNITWTPMVFEGLGVNDVIKDITNVSQWVENGHKYTKVTITYGDNNREFNAAYLSVDDGVFRLISTSSASTRP